MSRMILPVLAVMLLSSFSFAGERLPPRLPTLEKYTCEGDYFRVLVPVTWKRSDKAPPYADMTAVFGMRFEGPVNADNVPVTLSFDYYSGERNYTTADSYINARLSSPAREDADQGQATSELKLAGRKAIRFHMTTFELVTLPHDRPAVGKEGDPRVFEIAPPSKKVIMDEQYIVMPASTGFFVLRYRAPEEIADKHRAVFDKAAAAFEPLVP